MFHTGQQSHFGVLPQLRILEPVPTVPHRTRRDSLPGNRDEAEFGGHIRALPRVNQGEDPGVTPAAEDGEQPREWLAPSWRHRMDTALGWVGRLSRWAPARVARVERVTFGTRALSAGTPTAGAEYQRIPLYRYEVCAYLLVTWKRRRSYCGATAIPLTIGHIRTRSRGSFVDRVSSLLLSCAGCNQAKSNRSAARVLNCWRRRLIHIRTKHNRIRNHPPKSHTLNVLSVAILETVSVQWRWVPCVAATGRGSYAHTRSDRYRVFWPAAHDGFLQGCHRRSGTGRGAHRKERRSPTPDASRCVSLAGSASLLSRAPSSAVPTVAARRRLCPHQEGEGRFLPGLQPGSPRPTNQ